MVKASEASESAIRMRESAREQASERESGEQKQECWLKLLSHWPGSPLSLHPLAVAPGTQGTQHTAHSALAAQGASAPNEATLQTAGNCTCTI